MSSAVCSECYRLFISNYALQAEMRHVAAIYGPSAAEAEFNDRMEDEHGSHADAWGWADQSKETR